MNILLIKDDVLSDIRERISDEEIVTSSVVELLSEFCNWNGLQGWAYDLHNALDAFQIAHDTHASLAKNYLDDLRGRIDLADIPAMTPVQLLIEYCNWHGLVGWGEKIADTIVNLRLAVSAPAQI